MVKDKKYFWLKLQKDFFKKKEIRVIESMPNGKDYILFYLKLLCESVDENGKLRFNDEIPYSEQMLATITDTNIDIVRSAVKVFTELKMMELMDDGTYFMKEVNKMLGSETYWAQKKREYKLRDEMERNNALVGNIPTGSNNIPMIPSKSKEKEEEEREIYKPAKQSFAPPSVEDVEKYCKEKGYTLVDALAFVSFYDSKGWKVGKDKMTSWKSAVAGWEARERRKQPQAATAARQSATPTANDALERRRQMMGG